MLCSCNGRGPIVLVTRGRDTARVAAVVVVAAADKSGGGDVVGLVAWKTRLLRAQMV